MVREAVKDLTGSNGTQSAKQGRRGMTRTVAEVFAELVCDVDQAKELADAKDACEASFYGQTDRATNKWRHYPSIYDRHLARYRDRPVRLLEIGIHNGGSLQMWRRYLGPRAIIHGLDVDPRCTQIDDADLTIHIGSQDDLALLSRVVQEMGGVDIVIDDGSHLWSHQITTFEHLYGLVADDGVYICEDTHTSYWPDFGAQTPESFVEYAKRRLDELHVWYQLSDRQEGDSIFAQQTRGVSFYDSMVIFEKEVRSPPRNCTVGTRRVI